MGPFEKYIQHELDEVARLEQATEARRHAARELAQRLAGLLATRFGVDQVYLFGSTVTARFSVRSDIDLACAGLRSEDFFAAWSALNAAAGEFAVDLIVLETAPGLLRERVLAEGVVLFDRGRGEGR